MTETFERRARRAGGPAGTRAAGRSRPTTRDVPATVAGAGCAVSANGTKQAAEPCRVFSNARHVGRLE